MKKVGLVDHGKVLQGEGGGGGGGGVAGGGNSMVAGWPDPSLL